MTVDQHIPSPSGSLRPSGLCAGYVPPSTVFDEMEERDGSVRPHWNMFINLLDDLGPAETFGNGYDDQIDGLDVHVGHTEMPAIL